MFRRGDPPEATYAFKHALVQDAAYQSLLKSRRQQLHAKIADVLEERFPGVAEAEPEVLARHCTEAGIDRKGVSPTGTRPATASVARSAMAEAVAHFATRAGVDRRGTPQDPTAVWRNSSYSSVWARRCTLQGLGLGGDGPRVRTGARACRHRVGDACWLRPPLRL